MSNLRNILKISLIAIAFILSLTCYADVSVNGYYRKDGTYVRPHMRSNPDSSFRNNWSTVGNINPYTGKKGTKTVPTYTPKSMRNSSIADEYRYVSQLSNLSESNNTHSINNKKSSQIHNLSPKVNNPIELRDYETIQSENTLKIKVNGVNWYQVAKSKTDIAYVNKGVRERFNDYPTIPIMYKGALQLNGKPTWLGERFVKVIVDCKKDRIAVVADAIVDSSGKVLSDIDYPQNERVNWNSISDFFDPDLFKSTSMVCIS